MTRWLLTIIFLSGSVFASNEDASKSQIVAHANSILAEAKRIELDSVEVFKRSNELRNEIKKLRAEQRSSKGAASNEQFSTLLDLLNQQREYLQRYGGELRQRGNHLEQEGMSLVALGFIHSWRDKIQLMGPMYLHGNEQKVRAHNAAVRSVHPNLHGKMTDGAEVDVQQNMTLNTPALTGQDAPPDLDISTFQRSRNLHFFAHIEPIHETQPSVPLNRIHEWRLLLMDEQGRPVRNAAIQVDGHMPGHVHGLPTLPRMTKEISPGEYLIEGMKFQMTGWWVMQFDVDRQGTKDSLVFNLVL
jgi:hypothetical protein